MAVLAEIGNKLFLFLVKKNTYTKERITLFICTHY